MVKGKRRNQWKPIEINLADTAPDLLCFEELVDYKAIRGKNTHADYNDDDEKPKKIVDKKKSKEVIATKKGTKFTDNEEPIKKKRKLTNKKKRKKKKELELHGSENENSEPSEVSTDVQEAELDGDINMSAWAQFSLPETIIKALAAKKFITPTEIQSLTLPEAIEKKKDILGAAETGSGKTLAFAIPIVNALLKAKEKEDVSGLLWSLIVTPTRELAIQVKNHIRDLCAFTNIKVQEIVGGLSSEKQVRKLNERPEIVVGTPGRLWELFKIGNEHLQQINNVQFFVIDEADRMLEKHHFEELESLLERMNTVFHDEKSSIKSRQVFVFSATLSLTHAPPNYVFKRRKDKKKNTQKMTAEKKLSMFIENLGLKNPAIIDITKKHVLASGISESCIQCSLEEKDYYLYYLLKVHSGKKMIFCNSVACVKRLHRLLNILQCNAKILFADMEQKQRLKNLDTFQKHSSGLIITTDVAARGLDMANINYIIHYQVPKTAEIYVHRSGRSVRGVAAEGTSILLCSPAESYHYNKILKTLKKDSKLVEYDISVPEMMSHARQVVNVSRKIEQIETKIRKVQSDVNSIEKLAKAMDILVDDDEMPKKLDDRTRKTYQLEVKKLKAELNTLLKTPILPLIESLRYPRFEAVQSFLNRNSSNKN